MIDDYINHCISDQSISRTMRTCTITVLVKIVECKQVVYISTAVGWIYIQSL